MSQKQQFETLHKKIRHCKRCRLHKTRIHAVPGEGPVNAKLMFIGIGPGKTEDKTGKPFVGRSGKFLDQLLQRYKIDRKKCFITSIVKCRPYKNKPKHDEIDACLPYLLRQISMIKPKTIVCLGNIPKQVIETLGLSQKIINTYHPAAGMRFPKIKKAMQKHFKNAA